MAGNTVTLEFAGDAKKLAAASQQAQQSVAGVGESATAASQDMARAGQSATDYTDRIGKLGAGVEGMSGAFDSAGAAVQAMVDVQNAGRERAMRLARANADVEQAMIDSRQAAVDLRQAQEDLNQSQLDGKQAAIDVEQAEIDARQAKLDAKQAQEDYNTAVKEHGRDSNEARQAQIDLTQAMSDLNQARLDEEQAIADARQAQIDGTQATVDATQAVRDGKDAQLDLNDALHEANPSGLQQWADKINMITPILSGLVGVVGLVTAAQWAWNAAQLASPVTWIILAIVALVAVIVLIATKTDWFQRAWRASWGWIKDAAANTWDFLKKIPGWLGTAFSVVAKAITAPFRAAFNFIADAWNHTIGSLSWSVPGWVPFIGGNTINVPNLPKFHSGGVVPGAPGSEQLAILQAGETVTPAGAAPALVIRSGGAALDDLLVEVLSRAVRDRGGNVQVVLGGGRG